MRHLASMAVVWIALMVAPARAQDAGPTTIDAPFLLGAPEVKAAASPSEVRLGERFTLFVTAAHHDDVVVNLAEPLEIGAAFEVRARMLGEDRRRSDGLHIREWQIDVLPWELGDLVIPPIQIKFTRGGQLGAVTTRPVPIRVVAIVGDTDDARLLRTSAPPARLWRSGLNPIRLAAGIVLTLVMVYVLGRVSRLRLRRRRPAAALGVTVPRRVRRKLGAAAEEALARLAELEASGALDTDRKVAYRTMAEIIRTYLGQRYGFVTIDLTTTDLRRRLRDVGLPSASLLTASRWLDDCDLVKFANHHASGDEARTTLAEARELVMLTSGAGRPAETVDA